MSCVTSLLKSLRGRPARLAQGLRRSSILAGQNRPVGPPDAVETQLNIVERRNFCCDHARSCAGSSSTLDSMLARQRLERRGAAFDLILARRIDVEIIQVAAQRCPRPPGSGWSPRPAACRLRQAAGRCRATLRSAACRPAQQIMSAVAVRLVSGRQAAGRPRPSGRVPATRSDRRTVPRCRPRC